MDETHLLVKTEHVEEIKSLLQEEVCTAKGPLVAHAIVLTIQLEKNTFVADQIGA